MEELVAGDGVAAAVVVVGEHRTGRELVDKVGERAVAGRIGDEAELLEPGATVDVDGVDGAAGGGAGGAVVVGAAVLWLKIVPGEDKISRV